MTITFDGKGFAKVRELKLQKRVEKFKEKGITPKLVSIVVGNVGGGMFYQNLKKRKAEEIGCKLSVVSYQSSAKLDNILEKIEDLNTNGLVRGIMFQLPLPGNFTIKDRDKIIAAIDSKKDVDGMRDDSPFTAPVALAIIETLKKATDIVRPSFRGNPLKVVVVGHSGFEGKKVFDEIGKRKKEIFDVDIEIIGVDKETPDIRKETKEADIIVSITGVAGLVKKNMIKEGVILVDAGYPKGDIEKEAYKKASFVSPVPGGIGSVTICYLLDNLYIAAKD